MADRGYVSQDFARRTARAVGYVEGLVPAATAPDLRRPRRSAGAEVALIVAELTSFPEPAAPDRRRAVTLAPAAVLTRDRRGAAWINLVGDVGGAPLSLTATVRGRGSFEFGRDSDPEAIAAGLEDLGVDCEVHFGPGWAHEGWEYDPGRWLLTSEGPAFRAADASPPSPGEPALIEDLRIEVQRLGPPGPTPAVELVPTALRPTGRIRYVHAPLTAPPGLPAITAGTEAILERGPGGWVATAFDPHEYAGAAPTLTTGGSAAAATFNPYHFRPGVPWTLAGVEVDAGGSEL